MIFEFLILSLKNQINNQDYTSFIKEEILYLIYDQYTMDENIVNIEILHLLEIIICSIDT